VVAAKEFFAIEIPGWVKVCVPPDVSLMTPYILLEQEDWFEDEIKFVREYLQPGMRVIDIGVNYGTYFLTAAKKIGERGKIWGFEPSTQCCSFVEASIERNGFKNIELVQAGLSNRVGTAFLSLSENMELNTVADSIGEGVECESIELLSLDHCVETLGLTGIDFIKMDAEGEESNIIQGGARFFEENSPLIMFELKHGSEVNLKLIDEFNNIGYKVYRLVPGLNCLAPFDVKDPIDGYQLNLFCCKLDRAEVLHDQGWLVARGLQNKSTVTCKGLWKNYLLQFQYAKDLATMLGDDIDRSGESQFNDYYRALDLYAYSKDASNDVTNRYDALTESFELLNRLMHEQGNMSIALSFIRVASDYGKRGVAVGLLSEIINAIQSGQDVSLPVPFLAPCKTYDSLGIGDRFEQWLYSSIFTSHQLLSAYSSYFTRPENIQTIRFIESLGFPVPELLRRKLLTELRMGETRGNNSDMRLKLLKKKKKNKKIWKQLLN